LSSGSNCDEDPLNTFQETNSICSVYTQIACFVMHKIPYDYVTMKCLFVDNLISKSLCKRVAKLSSQKQSEVSHINLLNLILFCQLPHNLCDCSFDFETNGGNFSCDFVIDFQQHKKITFKCSYFHRSSIIIKNGNYTTLKQQMVFFWGHWMNSSQNFDECLKCCKHSNFKKAHLFALLWSR
jgi:hypothetical protein